MPKEFTPAKTKTVSPTFTEDEFDAIQRAAQIADRSMSSLVRWTVLCYLRENGYLPGAMDDGDDEAEHEGSSM
jgi:hypothetical protein